MCDFREITAIRVNDIIKEYNKIPHIMIHQMCDITKEGLYYICCTGGHYSYFNGEEWLPEGKGWEAIGFKTVGLTDHSACDILDI
jgi:hypothetical protein